MRTLVAQASNLFCIKIFLIFFAFKKYNKQEITAALVWLRKNKKQYVFKIKDFNKLFSYAFCVPYLLGTFLTSLFPMLFVSYAFKIKDFNGKSKSLLKSLILKAYKIKDNNSFCVLCAARDTGLLKSNILHRIQKA